MTNKKTIVARSRRWLGAGALLVACGFGMSSCDGYDLDDRLPDNWGSSIYNYMTESGDFTNMTRLVDDLGYTNVLAQTGSKTFFAANDEAFTRFYASNPWGVKRYEDLSLAQKKMLVYGAMVNNAYQLHALSSIQGPVEGECMRRLSALSEYDTVSVMTPAMFPAPVEYYDGCKDKDYWAQHRDKDAIWVMRDQTQVPIIHFMEKYLTNHKITNEDYDFIYNHMTHRQAGDASVNDVQVAEPNIRCSNGFIHRVADVMTPLPNMADLIAKNPNMTIFSRLLERFSAPYYCGEAVTKHYNELYDANVDSVYERRFFTNYAGRELVTDPKGNPLLINKDQTLPYDPGWNMYTVTSGGNANENLQRDMAAMLVPSDAAMTEYWNNGAGKVLKDRYGDWDKIPLDVVSKLVGNVMQASFLACVPSRFQYMLNDANDPMGVEESQIDSVYLACNGAVYLTNVVYAPTTFVSVMYPVTINKELEILNWAIPQKGIQYEVYLNSLNSKYSFFVPTGKAFLEYIDPVSYNKKAHARKQLWRFHYDVTRKEEGRVYASVHNIDPVTGEVGDSLETYQPSYEQVKNRLKDILETHIVVSDVTPEYSYYRSKNGCGIHVNNVNAGANGMTVEGSYQMNHGTPVKVDYIYKQENGNVYQLNSEPLMGTYLSVDSILRQHSEFSEFLSLLEVSGVTTDNRDGRPCSDDHCINVFNSYHYTVYIPSNEGIKKLYSLPDNDPNKLPTVSELNALELSGNEMAAEEAREKIAKFIKYHIQDNALYIGAKFDNGEYETSLFENNGKTKRFARVKVANEGGTLKVTDEQGNVRTVATSNKGLYNQQAREYIFNGENIYTSSSAVVHYIDAPLMRKK